MNKKNLITYIELTIAMVSLGVTVVSGKFLVSTFPIFLLLGIRFLIGSLTFLPIAYLQTGNLQIVKQADHPLNVNEWVILFLQAFFGALLFNVLMLYGLRLSTATAAGILTSTTPAFTTLLAFLLLAETINRRKVLAVISAIIGIIIININVGPTFSLGWNFLGNTLIILAVISGAFLTIFIKRLANRVTAVGMALTFNVFGLALFLPLAVWDSFHYNFNHHAANLYFLVILYGVSGSVIFPILWNHGISRVTASTASLFAGILPISTTFLAYLFLNEKFTFIQAIGMVCVLLAILFDVI